MASYPRVVVRLYNNNSCFGMDSSLALHIAAVRYCTLSSMFELRSISFSRSLSDSRVRYLAASDLRRRRMLLSNVPFMER